jgi:hypothetical protein
MAVSVNNHTAVEVADVLKRHGEEYRRNNGMSNKQHKVMTALANCRTAWFGYHEDACDECGHIERDFNSCRDRHCPKCQGISRRKWVNARLTDILPVPHYHVVFTLPYQLQPLTAYNKKVIYDLLFSCSSQTLLAFGSDPKWLGGELGFYGVLHTWGQKLWQHPHLHYVVPGGALTAKKRWVSPRYHGKFLFPVRALSKVFRGKFIEALKEAYRTENLSFSPEMQHLRRPKAFKRWLDHLVARNWIVYSKSPLNKAKQVVRYIGRYTHRVAISNRRILDIKDGQVWFKYKDYRANRTEWKTAHLDAQEFIRRFLWHVLPTGFHKIRHFGYLANGRRKHFLALIKSLLEAKNDNEKQLEADHWRPACPKCEKGKLIPRMIVTPFNRILLTASIFFKGGHGGYVCNPC